MEFHIRRGLDLELGGAPEQRVEGVRAPSRVAVLPADHVGLRPRLLIEQGAHVLVGEPLLSDRDRPGLVLTSPGGGVVAEVVRGARRALRAVVIELDGEEPRAELPVTPRAQLAALPREEVVRRLLEAGLWPALRERPFGHPAEPRAEPRALLVTAIDTNPLAARPEVCLAGKERAFEDGLRVLGRLLDGPLFLCVAAGSPIGAGDAPRVTVARFSGPHPAGLVGTHAHLLAPVARGRPVWHVGCQEVAAIGTLFTEGRLELERVIALGGPRVRRPRLLRTRLGAALDELLDGELTPGHARVVSGSVLSGRQAAEWGRYLGRFHTQVAVLVEPDAPAHRPLLSRLLPVRAKADTTARHGRTTPFLALEAFERVLPLDLAAAPLLRALLAGDVETAEQLGCLELEEEDLALCTYVCPSKQEYGAHLRAALDALAEAG